MSQYIMDNIKKLNDIIARTERVYHTAAAKLGLSGSVMHILYSVSINGGSCPLAFIINETGISKQTINSALRNMERDGLVYLESHTGRQKAVCLTQEGTLLAQKTAMVLLSAEKEILTGWDKEDFENYIALSQRYLDDISAKVKDL